jgi:cellulose synthase/poly-beta-1,6-N-acetylglucosamine synthase-like glycosyltransferase
MSGWVYLYITTQFLVLAYFALLNLLYALFGYLGLRSVVTCARESSQLMLKDLLERDLELPVSMLVAAFNEERTIEASVESLLALSYPEFEVLVVSDGTTDRTIERLIEGFALVEQPRVYRRVLLPSRSFATRT